MPNWNIQDICEAYYQLEVDYNINGWLRERPSNRLRMESSEYQISRLRKDKINRRFLLPNWNGYENLTENGKAIYHMLRKRYGFDKIDDWVQDSDGIWFWEQPEYLHA